MGTLSPALHEEEPGLVGQAGELPKGVEEGQQVVVEACMRLSGLKRLAMRARPGTNTGLGMKRRGRRQAAPRS